MQKPNKKKSIKEYCLACSGDSPKEVTFCHLVDCPLWPFRTGSYVTTVLYRNRIEKAFHNHPDEVADLEVIGLKKEDYLNLTNRQESSLSDDEGSDDAEKADSFALMA